MSAQTGGNAGVAGTLVSFLVDGDANTALPFNFTVIEHTGGIAYPTISRRGRGDGAAVTATISGGALTGGNITNAGFGYLGVALVVSGGGGANGTLTGTLTNGALTGVALGAGGSGYTAVPTVTINETSGGTPRTKLGDIGGGGTLKGKYQNAQFPWPSQPKYATGVLRYTMQMEGVSSPPVAVDYIDFPARLEDIEWAYVEEKDTGWRCSAKWKPAGDPVMTWKGNRVTVSAPSANDVSTVPDGMSKNYDNNGITTTANSRIDSETIGNSDEAEVTKLVAMAATLTAPMPNLKLDALGLVRTESNGLALTATWALQDSKDNIETPQNVLKTDPNAITSTRTLAIVYTTGSPPATPSAPSGLKLVEYTDHKINDQLTVRSYLWALRDSVDDITMPHTDQNLDPSNLASASERAAVTSATIPVVPSDQVVYDTIYNQIGDGKLVTITKYGLQTRGQEVINNAQNSSRSALEPYTDVTCAIVDSTDTPANIANSQWAAYQLLAFIQKITVEKLTPGKARVLGYFLNPGTLVQGFTGGGGRLVDARVSGGNVQLYIVAPNGNLARGTGVRQILFARQWIIDKPIRRFVISRMLTGTTIPEQTSLIGKTNNATFLGLAQGTCVYEGPTFSTNIALVTGGNLQFGMGYQFMSDANGMFTSVPQSWFLYPQTLTTAVTSTGWVTASTLGLSDIVAPSQGDFSVFTA